MKKKRLVYLYVSTSCAAMDSAEVTGFDPLMPTSEPYADLFIEEGNYILFQRLIKKNVFDEALVVIESPRAPGARVLWNGTIQILVVPNIECLWPFLESRRYYNVIWTRHGWKSWFPFLEKWHDQKDGWTLFYRAAGNRQPWPFWDVILEDLTDQVHIVESVPPKMVFPFSKPVDPSIFYQTNIPRIYDLCVGASHIHDKKGQWMIAAILDEYANQYNEKLQCIMPGSWYHSPHTNELINHIKNYPIATPGMLPRNILQNIYNQSKLFLHMGTLGQNDRGVIEAMCCGTPVAIANPDFHPKFTTRSTRSFSIDPGRPWVCARQIKYALSLIDEEWRNEVKKIYEAENGLDSVVVPKMEKLLTGIFSTRHKDRRILFDQLLADDAEMRSERILWRQAH